MKNIKNIITAVGDQKLNLELRNKGFKIKINDISYQEGILEYLEENKDEKIEYLILNEKLFGNFNIEELIYNIKNINNKIKIILITTNKNNKIKVYKKIEKIKIDEIIKIINEENIFYKKNIPIKNIFSENEKEGKIITMLGPNGIGKSIFSINYAKSIENKKILIIDFDALNNSLHSILGIKKYSNKIKENIKKEKGENKNIENLIIKGKYNIDLISGINLIFEEKHQSSANRVKNIIKEISNNYDITIIDTSAECFLDYTKEIIKISEKIIFISGANLLEIKKSLKLLEIYTKEWGVAKEKINLIFNKYTQNSISEDILRNIFKKYNIIGKIKLSDYYDLLINKNNLKIKQIKKDIDVIKNKENKKIKIKYKK